MVGLICALTAVSILISFCTGQLVLLPLIWLGMFPILMSLTEQTTNPRRSRIQVVPQSTHPTQ
jgi:hypothetical protein